MTIGNETAGRARPGAAPARRPAIASPAGLAARLGRELSPFEADDNGWTDRHYAAALSAPESARSLLAAGAPRGTSGQGSDPAPGTELRASA